MREHQCTDCMVGQGRRCSCAESDDMPTLGTFLLLLPAMVLLRAVDGVKAALRQRRTLLKWTGISSVLLACALGFGLALGRAIAWVTL